MFLRLKIQPKSHDIIFWGFKLCSRVENSSETTPKQFLGWVFNDRMFWCYGVYGSSLHFLSEKTTQTAIIMSYHS